MQGDSDRMETRGYAGFTIVVMKLLVHTTVVTHLSSTVHMVLALTAGLMQGGSDRMETRLDFRA